MFRRGRSLFSSRLFGPLLVKLTLATFILPAVPASAEGLFDFLFNPPRRPPPSANAYADPNPSYNSSGGRRNEGERRVSGGSAVFCVRLCDGRYFPIQRAGGANAAQLCSSFCPASQTKIFSGGGNGIEHAVANDGTRYPSLRNAFAYRERMVENCTCNGRDPYGLVTLNATEDPTLHNGDIVATNEGFVAYRGGRRQNAEFTPIDSHPSVSAESRQRLSETRIVPNATPVPSQTIRDGAAAHDDRDRRVQLER